MIRTYIKGISSYLPEKILTNEELVREFPEWTVEKIAQKVGVNIRHIAGKKETAADMAVKASENLFNSDKGIRKQDIDFVIFCTQSPDYLLPTSACLIQSKLGLNKNIGAFDFNLGCSGYIYGLAIAKGLICSRVAQNVLLLTAETYSKYLHPRDKGNRTIFGDGATASVISSEGFAEIGEFVLGSDGEGADNLIIKSGGARCPEDVDDLIFDENGNPISSNHLVMNGSEIFTFTQRNVPKLVKETIAKNNLTRDEINWFVFHQANSYMLEFLRKKIKIEPEKFIIDMAETGNTVSNSIPLILEKLNNKNKLHGNILLCGFGVGYSWGGVCMKAT